MDVNFSPARPYFVAGDIIQGILTLSTSNSGVVIGHVEAEVTCTADAYYTLFHPGNEDSPGYHELKQQSYQYLKASPFVVFDARPTGGASLSSTMMQPIGLQIPVKDEIPSNLTSRNASLEYYGATVSHPMSVGFKLKLTTFAINGKVLHEKISALNIRALHLYPNAERPLKAHNTVYTGSCCWSNVFTFFCVTDRTVYGPGDRMRLSYWYETKSPSNMPKIVSVTIKLSFNAKTCCPSSRNLSGLNHCHSLHNSVSLIENSCSVPSLGQMSQVFVDVPMDVIPDFTLESAPHPLVYRHEFIMILGVGRRMIRMPVPVVFNSLSLGHLAQYPYPVLQKPLPHSTVQAQALYVSQPNPPALTAPSVGVPSPSGGPYFLYDTTVVAPSPYFPSGGVAVAPGPGHLMYSVGYAQVPSTTI